MAKTTSANDLKENKDSELLILFADGNIEAYNELVNRHKDSLYNYLMKISRASPDCEDVAQEAFILLFEYQSKVRNIENFQAWIYKIAYNNAVKKHIVREREKTDSLDDIEDHEGYLHKYHRDEYIEDLREFDERKTPSEMLEYALNEIEGTYREAILLRYDNEFDYYTIAEVLSVPIGTVRSRISRGREQLKQIIAEQYGNKNYEET